MSERVALVTGVSRRGGIAATVARHLADSGYRLLLTGLPRYDSAQPHGADPEGVAAVLAPLGDRAAHIVADLTDPAAPAALVRAALDRYGRLDALVAAHAHSTATPLGALEAEEVDRHLAVNVRATMLLTQEFTAAFESTAPGPAGGRVVLFSSGQRLGPMPDELAYAASKAGVELLTRQFARLLMPRGITVNCVNPGPTDTGYLSGAEHAAVARRFPGGRWGTPEDAARLVAWLCSPDAHWITGQVIDSEGGFDRYA